MKFNSLSVREIELKKNTKILLYPDGRHKAVISSKALFISGGWERSGDHESVLKPKTMTNEVRGDSMRRARQAVFDIARLNDFFHFITWTLDGEKIDRYNPHEVSKKLKYFLDNMSRRKGLKYLVIPEHHKDGALHMHGLVAGDYKLTNTGKHTKGGQPIYNMPDWSLGFSTAIPLDNQKERIANYITKYISKDFKKIFGSFYYAGGHGLQRKPDTVLLDVPYSDIDAKAYCKFGVGYKYVELGDYTDANANTEQILYFLGVELNGEV